MLFRSLLLLLHGLGSDENDPFGLASGYDGRFCCVSARAPNSWDPSGWAWYHSRFTPEGPVIDAEEAEESRLALLRFIAELVAKLGLDAERVFLAGFSQGAIMSLYVGLTEPRGIAGVVAMSGRLLHEVLPRLAPLAELRGLPLLVQHGTRDGVLPIRFGREAKKELEGLPLALDYREYDMDHEITAASLADAEVWLRARLDSGRG